MLHIMWTSLLNLLVVLPSHLCLAVLFFPSYVSESVYTFRSNVCASVLLQQASSSLSTDCFHWRSTCLRRYSGEKNVFFQNQVIDHWLFYPLQAFCFNFGVSHILHHYVTRQPFYLRQMCAPRSCMGKESDSTILRSTLGTTTVSKHRTISIGEPNCDSSFVYFIIISFYFVSIKDSKNTLELDRMTIPTSMFGQTCSAFGRSQIEAVHFAVPHQ